jgi:hypothetical protein
MYSSNYPNSNQSFQNQFGATGNVQSQYKGFETKYQPLGFVQSQYNQATAPTSFGSQSQFQNQYQNQNLNQFQNQSSLNNATMSNMNNQLQYGSYQTNPQSYHTANYRGNQPGHDAYLRSDSMQPSQSQFAAASMNQNFGSQGISQNYGQNAMNTGFQNSFGSGYQTNPQSYHTASYRGNQPGHDSYLRSDSSQPAQQFGIGSTGMVNSFGGYNTARN